MVGEKSTLAINNINEMVALPGTAADAVRAPLLLSKKLRAADNASWAAGNASAPEEFSMRAAVWPANCPPLFDSQRDEQAALGLSIQTLKRLRLQVGVTVSIQHAGSDAPRYALIAAIGAEHDVEDGAALRTPRPIPCRAP